MTNPNRRYDPYEYRVNGQNNEELELFWEDMLPNGNPSMNRPRAVFPEATPEAMGAAEINIHRRDSDSQDGVDEYPSARRRKKPKGNPKRPLSAYNFFFKEERARLMESGIQEDGPTILPSGKIPFADLGKNIGRSWGNLTEAEKSVYRNMAEQDLMRYRKDMESFNERKEKEVPKDDPTWSNEAGVARLPTEADPFSRSYHGPEASMNGSRQRYATHAMTPPPDTHYRRGDDVASHASRVEDGRNYYSYDPRNAYPYYHPQNYQFAGGGMGGIQEHYFPPNNQEPIPPGTEVFTRDHDGVEKRFTVNYACVWVPQDEATQFLDRMSGREGAHVASQPDLSHMLDNFLNGAHTFISSGPHHPNPSWSAPPKFGHDPTCNEPPNQNHRLGNGR